MSTNETEKELTVLSNKQCSCCGCTAEEEEQTESKVLARLPKLPGPVVAAMADYGDD